MAVGEGDLGEFTSEATVEVPEDFAGERGDGDDEEQADEAEGGTSDGEEEQDHRGVHLEGVALDTGDEQDVLDLLDDEVDERDPDELIGLGGGDDDEAGDGADPGPDDGDQFGDSGEEAECERHLDIEQGEGDADGCSDDDAEEELCADVTADELVGDVHDVRRVALQGVGHGVQEVIAGVVAVAHGVEHPEGDDGEAEDEADGAGDDTDGALGEGGGGIGGCVECVIETGVDAGLHIVRDAVAVDIEPFVELAARGVHGFGEGIDELGDLVDGDGDDLGAGEEEEGGDDEVDEEDCEATSVDIALMGACGDDLRHTVDERGESVGEDGADGEGEECPSRLPRDVNDDAHGGEPERGSPSVCGGHPSTMPETREIDR